MIVSYGAWLTTPVLLLFILLQVHSSLPGEPLVQVWCPHNLVSSQSNVHGQSSRCGLTSKAQKCSWCLASNRTCSDQACTTYKFGKFWCVALFSADTMQKPQSIHISTVPCDHCLPLTAGKCRNSQYPRSGLPAKETCLALRKLENCT